MNTNLKRKLLSKIRAPKSDKRDKFIILRVSSKKKSEIQTAAKRLRCNVSRYLLGLHDSFNETV